MSLKQFLFLLKKKLFGREPYPALSKLVRLFNGGKNPDILYFGDSVVERVSWNDQNQMMLGDLLKQKLSPELNLEHVTHSGYHSGMYLDLLQTLPYLKGKPRLVLIPINMRSFSPQWHYHPAFQFTEEREAINEFLKDPDVKIRALNEASEPKAYMANYDGVKVKYPLTPLSSIGEFRKIIDSDPRDPQAVKYRKEQIFIFHYLHGLDSKHPKLNALLEIVTLCRAMDIKLFLYVTPINHEAGVKFVGPAFKELYQRNIEMLKAGLFKASFSGFFKDYSFVFDAAHFFNPDNPTEHLAFAARDQFSGTLAGEIKKFFKDLNACINT